MKELHWLFRVKVSLIHIGLFISKYKKIIMAAAAISAIIHITIGIASSNGVLVFENNLIIKYSEIIFSIIIVWLFIHDINTEYQKICGDT